MKRLAIAALALFVWALPAYAVGTSLKPLWSPDRLALAAGANYAFYDGAQANLPAFHKEWTVGGYSAWNLLPSLDARLQYRYGMDNKTSETLIGVSTPLPVPTNLPQSSLSAAAGYGFHAGPEANLPHFHKEFEAGLAASYRLAKDTKPWTVLLAASSMYRLDSKDFDTEVGLRLVLKSVKED